MFHLTFGEQYKLMDKNFHLSNPSWLFQENISNMVQVPVIKPSLIIAIFYQNVYAEKLILQ